MASASSLKQRCAELQAREVRLLRQHALALEDVETSAKANAALVVRKDNLAGVETALLELGFPDDDTKVVEMSGWESMNLAELLERSDGLGGILREEQERVMLAAHAVRYDEEIQGPSFQGAFSGGGGGGGLPAGAAARLRMQAHATPMPSARAIASAAVGDFGGGSHSNFNSEVTSDGESVFGDEREAGSGGLLLRIHDLEEQVEVGKLLLRQEKANAKTLGTSAWSLW